ncbi:enoyl-CoA hydratase/isomerase family protein [Geodermatophilus sp. DSM 44513]|uniref:enoyl-CoA hydratase/isomerase family protein n=1 Tax=Geodermatophilus sp. DSM 44513 TaxID=1528104 RepID=UPI0012824895|nr:enoyl-CoA hydratase/isomerase family protein [Geodermatophilus sp. DSM 44513]WNV74357.1 enoyl-CoA hydratase/isomerase family protein [Geodermatophilus sp. DSM 44513]
MTATVPDLGSGVHLRYETPHIAVLTLDSEPANTFSWESRRSFMRALDILDADEDVRCLVITGKGRAFTAGAQLREDQSMTDEQLTDYLAEFGRVLNGVQDFRAPVIAAINGATVGGGLEFALCSDIRIASTEAFFVAAGVNVGLIVSFWRLPRVVGLGAAKEILLTGARYTAEQALNWGLVTEVHEPADLMPAALAKAQRIATRAPLSVEVTKSAVTQAIEMDFAEGQALQTQRFLEMFRTDDHQEALRAFFEKRDGDYRRR